MPNGEMNEFMEAEGSVPYKERVSRGEAMGVEGGLDEFRLEAEDPVSNKEAVSTSGARLVEAELEGESNVVLLDDKVMVLLEMR